jgi:peptidoglycan hydrolase CwlO-like protein
MVAFTAAMTAATPASALSGGDIGSLAAQRQALQKQAEGVLGERVSTLAQILDAHDRIADLSRQIDRKSVRLDELKRHQVDLSTDIAATAQRIRSKRAALADLTRQQYKTLGQGNISEILFGSSNLGQVIDRIAATQAVSTQAHTTIIELKSAERALARQSSTLHDQQQQALQARERLATQKAFLLAQAADYETRVGALDQASKDLLARIEQLNAAIAAANQPPTGGDIPSRQAIIQVIRAAAARFGADGDQMVRVAGCESGLNPRAYDPRSGASGLFQFMPGTFYGHGGHDIWDAADQSSVAAQMFSHGQAGAWDCK